MQHFGKAGWCGLSLDESLKTETAHACFPVLSKFPVCHIFVMSKVILMLVVYTVADLKMSYRNCEISLHKNGDSHILIYLEYIWSL